MGDYIYSTPSIYIIKLKLVLLFVPSTNINASSMNSNDATSFSFIMEIGSVEYINRVPYDKVQGFGASRNCEVKVI